MDEIKQRLKDSSEACITTYEAWRGKPHDHAAREALQEAVHELRKVAARLEIELAVSDRKQQGNEPIPIPSHRASRRPAQGTEPEGDDDRNNRGNQQPGGQQAKKTVQIRRPAGEENANPGNDAGGEEDGQRRSKPLSLRRSNPEGGE